MPASDGKPPSQWHVLRRLVKCLFLASQILVPVPVPTVDLRSKVELSAVL